MGQRKIHWGVLGFIAFIAAVELAQHTIRTPARAQRLMSVSRGPKIVVSFNLAELPVPAGAMRK